MKKNLKRVRYLTIIVDLIAAYFVTIGIISFINIGNIIVSGMPEEDLSFKGLFMAINGFYPYMVLLFGTIVCFEMFVLGKHRYLKGDCMCIALESRTIARVNEQAIIKMKKERRLSEDIEKMKAVEYFRLLKDTSFSVSVILNEE